LTEKQKTYLHEGEALKLRIDAGEHLSRKENVLVAERASIIALIDNAKKKRASELIAQKVALRKKLRLRQIRKL